MGRSCLTCGNPIPPDRSVRARYCSRRCLKKVSDAKLRTPEYNAWRSMHERCNKPNSRSYPIYGGRGIRVCERWKHYETFLADVGSRPGPGYSIDRKDCDGNYEPGNVRWATPQQQGRNVRWLRDRGITINGETKLLCEWSEQYGIPRKRLWNRIFRKGWSPERALEEPVHAEKIAFAHRH